MKIYRSKVKVDKVTMDLNGQITKEEFNDLMDDFIRKSGRLNNDWQIRETASFRYASKTTTCHVEGKNTKIQNEDDDGIDTLEDIEEDIDADGSCLKNQAAEVLSFEYHILFSESYSVPVLYFNAYTRSGKLISLDDVWSLVPEHYRDRLASNRWSFITQVEHPYLGRPFYQLHPCNTEKLMSASSKVGSENSEKENYLIRWLSLVGPVVNIKIPFEYGLPEADHSLNKEEV